MSPFQGTLQVIRSGAAEAECRDGITWIIYIASENILSHTGMNEIRYGTWTSSAGLRKARVIGSPLAQDHRDMIEQILRALEQYSGQIPFPGIDYYEQWLLSKQSRAPIAILNTAIHRGEFNPKQSPYDWRPSQSVIKHFRSNHGQVNDLITSMKSFSSIQPKAIWVRRDQQGNAYDLNDMPLDDMCFPHTPVQPACFEGSELQLVNDYLDCDAPAILQLLTLPKELRARLEQAAWLHPLQVADLYRLYPFVLDPEGLKVTLVKARLIGYQENTEGWHEPFLPYVNE